MLNPTLSDLIGGIQSVTLGDEEARRRRTQKSVLERKAPPTFDVIVEIQDRERVAVHSDVAETVDAMLRGDAGRPRAALARRGGRPPLAGPAAAVARASSSARSGSPASSAAGSPWRMEPGWRGDGRPVTGRRLPRGGARRVPAGLPARRVRRLAPDPRRVRPRERPARPRLGGWRTRHDARVSGSSSARAAAG